MKSGFMIGKSSKLCHILVSDWLTARWAFYTTEMVCYFQTLSVLSALAISSFIFQRAILNIFFKRVKVRLTVKQAIFRILSREKWQMNNIYGPHMVEKIVNIAWF